MYSGESRIYLAVLTGALVIVALSAIFMASIIYYHRRKIASQREAVNAEINALEKERTRIASDLHDDLGASLSAIKLRLQCLATDQHVNSELIGQTEGYIDGAMDKIRRISFNIMPQVLHRKGLRYAVAELMHMLFADTDIRINFSCDDCTIATDKRVHMYRMLQEIMNNILKHAHATAVGVQIKKLQGKIQLHISDNGVGFDKKAMAKKPNGDGLSNIMARAELLNATVHLTATPGKGVHYLIEIPSNG